MCCQFDNSYTHIKCDEINIVFEEVILGLHSSSSWLEKPKQMVEVEKEEVCHAFFMGLLGCGSLQAFVEVAQTTAGCSRISDR